MNSSEFKDRMSKIPTGVSVVSVLSDSQIEACTISSLTSVDLYSRQILFVLRSESKVLKGLRKHIFFSINNLSTEQFNLSKIFSEKTRSTEFIVLGKYWNLEENIFPTLTGVVQSFGCVFERTYETESSTIVFARLLKTITSTNSQPLVYFNRSYHSTQQIDHSSE